MNCESFRKLIADAGLTPKQACKLATALILEDQAEACSEPQRVS